MMRVSTVAQMRAMDARAIGELGIREELLMENAGMSAAGVAGKIARSRWGGLRGRRVVVLCGIGNNGGDGLVVARLLHSAGAKVAALVLGDPAGYRGAARSAWEAARKLEIQRQVIRDGAGVDEAMRGADLVVDAIFGTGLSRAVEGSERAAVLAIEAARAAGATVLSLDIPSGVHGDSGAILGVAVRADHTVAFGLPKLGNLLYPGFARCGRLWVSHISFPPELYERGDLLASTNDPVPLPERDPDGHKGKFGEVLFVAGSRAYLGAPILAALAHLKAGGGYARLATPASLVPALAAGAREVVFVPQPETASGSVSASGLPALLDLASASDMVVIGPGLSLDPEAGTVTLEVLRSVKRPVLVDGDGLTHLSRSPETAAKREGPLVLTPHPGELARLLGRSVSEVREKRVECLREAAGRYRAIVVAKGAHSLVGLPDGRLFVNLTGNSGMATPGSGDVLAGSVAAMHGLGLALEEAVRDAVLVHGLAGDLAAAELGEDGITASDILGRLPAAVRKLRTGSEGILAGSRPKIREL
jgi:ADP-dependent NAD(P)H-hydrate dehydratase / NAD(P)H-hydrate epimerase